MKTAWTKGLSVEESNEIAADYKAAVYLRQRLTKMLEEKIRVAYEKSISESGFDNPNWALKQADSVGYRRALQEIINNLK